MTEICMGIMDSSFRSIEQSVEELIREGVERFLKDAAGEAPDGLEVALETPRNPDHGDWACSVALRLAKPMRRAPLQIAQEIAARVPKSPLIAPPEVAAPGFINLRLGPDAVGTFVTHVLGQAERFGHSDVNAGHRVLVEFVSANPTGPLHIGHCRGAVIGDSLARILAATGCRVSREYYYNDAGVQMRTLGESLRARYLQALGVSADLPENGYRGDYMIELGEQLAREKGPGLKDETSTQPFTDYAAGHILKLIEADLEALRIHFDTWFSETTLHQDGRVGGALDALKEAGQLYENESAWWLRTTDYGDEKDRVVIKTDGEFTYLAPDIAYHRYKFERGFDRLIDVLGADHHGYVPRLKAAVQALGHPADSLGCVMVQMVAVKRGEEVIKLSTRAGDFITLKDVIDEIGADVTRFLFLMRSPDSQMVFDFDLAKDTSMNNPLYYIQYAHARCCSLMRKASEEGMEWDRNRLGALDRLSAPEELAMVRQMDRLGAVVIECAAFEDPMPLTGYLRDLATSFHAYFTAGNKESGLRVVQPDDAELTQARLCLIGAVRQALANGLALLGVVPLERL